MISFQKILSNLLAYSYRAYTTKHQTTIFFIRAIAHIKPSIIFFSLTNRCFLTFATSSLMPACLPARIKIKLTHDHASHGL